VRSIKTGIHPLLATRGSAHRPKKLKIWLARISRTISMTTANAAFIVDNAGRFPTFCAVAFRNERQAAWVDFWAVKPSGDAAADYARGLRYAEEAIRHVGTTGQPVFIECVLLFMSIKLRHRQAGELERGFIDRIVNDFPHALDDVISRLSRHRFRRLS
jgi:hypothetical protein